MPGLNRMLARPSRWASLFVTAIALLPVPSLAAQVTPPQQSAGSPRAATLPLNPTDPRRPEIQPSLSVDRDPVPSPDVEAPEASLAPPNVPTRGSELEKSKNGVYTLHENVDEVLLNCTVIDEKGASRRRPYTERFSGVGRQRAAAHQFLQTSGSTRFHGDSCRQLRLHARQAYRRE